MDREILIVADAGPIIALATIGRFDLLRQVAKEVVVPRAVHAEVLAGAPKPGASEVAAATWIHVVDGPPELVSSFRQVVDLGEAEALAVAKTSPGALLLVDDLRARRIAEQLGLRLTGTLGVLGMGKRQKLLKQVRPEVARLMAAGFRIEPRLADAFLHGLGE